MVGLAFGTLLILSISIYIFIFTREYYPYIEIFLVMSKFSTSFSGVLAAHHLSGMLLTGDFANADSRFDKFDRFSFLYY